MAKLKIVVSLLKIEIHYWATENIEDVIIRKHLDVLKLLQIQYTKITGQVIVVKSVTLNTLRLTLFIIGMG